MDRHVSESTRSGFYGRVDPFNSKEMPSWLIIIFSNMVTLFTRNPIFSISISWHFESPFSLFSVPIDFGMFCQHFGVGLVPQIELDGSVQDDSPWPATGSRASIFGPNLMGFVALWPTGGGVSVSIFISQFGRDFYGIGFQTRVCDLRFGGRFWAFRVAA